MVVNKKRKRKRRVSCFTDFFCKEGITHLDYRDTNTLKKFINPQGRIIPQLFTRLLRKHQNRVALAIKRAREMALLNYELVLQNVLNDKK